MVFCPTNFPGLARGIFGGNPVWPQVLCMIVDAHFNGDRGRTRCMNTSGLSWAGVCDVLRVTPQVCRKCCASIAMFPRIPLSDFQILCPVPKDSSTHQFRPASNYRKRCSKSFSGSAAPAFFQVLDVFCAAPGFIHKNVSVFAFVFSSCMKIIYKRPNYSLAMDQRLGI